MRYVFAAMAALAVWMWSERASAAPVAEITQYGITWKLAEPREAGQFVTGDWWVVGPVTIESVTPAPTASRNGSAVDPKGGRQGYDDRGGEFSTADRVTFPHVLKIDQSLVSSISRPEGDEVKNVGALLSQAVLTAVAAPPSPTTFRPSYAGTYKKYLDASAIRAERLPKLPAPASLPDGADLLRQADRPRIDHLSSWTIQDSCAQDNWYNGEGAHACYGREYATFVSDAALYVMLDTKERDELTRSMIQIGIDNYGVLRAGGNWAPNGGHHNARKWPIVFAAVMLDDCDMLKVGLDYEPATFGEDGQTYSGTSGKALFGWDCGGGQGSYFESGCSGGGAKDCRDPAGVVDGCADYRDCCTSAYWIGEMLSTLMLGGKVVWDHDPFFDYVDRWMKGDVSGQSETSSAFVTAMWTTYRNALPTTTTISTTCGAPPSGVDAGSSRDDAGSSTAGAPNEGAANDAAPSDGGGCGCRSAPSSFGSLVWLALAAAGAALLRRKR